MFNQFRGKIELVKSNRVKGVPMAFNFSTGDTFELHIKRGAEQQIFRTLIDHVVSEKQFAIYTPLAQGKVLLLAEDQRFEVVFSQLDPSTNKYDLYSFNATLKTRVNRDNVAMWIIERISDFKKKQRRDFFRLSFVKEMFIELEQEPEKKIQVLSRDISAGGLRCVVTKKIPIGTIVICHLNLVPSHPMVIRAKVVVCDLMTDSSMKYDLRVTFIGVSKALESELVTQINHVQGEYLKRVADEGVNERMEEVMAHLDLQKIKQNINDQKYDNRLGYWMALQWLMIFVLLALYGAARPVEEYPLDRFFNILIRGGWKIDNLVFNVWLSIAILVVSLTGLIADRTRYLGRKPVKLSFVIGFFISILSLMILATLYAIGFAGL